MSERAEDPFSGFARNLLSRMSRKLSGLLFILINHKSAGSIGALAGFAIAVVFTWKFLRSPPGGQRRRPPKRRNTPSTSAAAGSSNSGGSGVVDSSAEAVSSQLSINELDASQLTLGQIVRIKLGGCRKMTCQLLGVILEETSLEELQKHATLRPSVVELVHEISKTCDLYLMETVHDDETEERVLLALESAGIFQSGGLIKDKVLFCSKDMGRSSFVRQLEADWHVDTNLDIITQLARFIRYQLHISPNPLCEIAPNVATSTSLEQFFSSLG